MPFWSKKKPEARAPAQPPPAYWAPPGPPPGPPQHQPPPQPPAGPPPSYENHDWQAAVPDTSLFPPPPAIFAGFDRSPATNAPEEEARLGERWCEENPLSTGATALTGDDGAVRLMEPVGFEGTMSWYGPGRWHIETRRAAPDRCLISYPPLYRVQAGDKGEKHAAQQAVRTIYYEVRILPDSPGVTVALGMAALPYPSFRMPGWHRGSLGVHGDDGHRFVNDTWGGKEFTRPFARGETLGLGMTVRPAEDRGGSLIVDVFFTRNGEMEGGWNIHEETDAQADRAVTGLEGFHDICAAVGTYDGVKVDVVFDPAAWMYRGAV